MPSEMDECKLRNGNANLGEHGKMQKEFISPLYIYICIIIQFLIKLTEYIIDILKI